MNTYFCPNSNCENNQNPSKKFYIKKGFYKTKYNHQPVPRYQCKSCGKKFSSHTFRDTFKQHRPDINITVFELYSERMSLRAISDHLRVNIKTVVRKLEYLAVKSRIKHQQVIESGGIKTSYVQFDEMETFEHTKLKPISIAVAIRAKTREIIGLQVAEMNCKGHTAELSRSIYGWRNDTRKEACQSVMELVKKCSKESLTVATDGKRAYPNAINEVIPHANVESKKRSSKKGGYDTLFSLNKVCANLRKDISRLARKTMITTKNKNKLQMHLDIYIAFNNGYFG